VSVGAILRGLMRREFLIVCFIIFSANLVSGILSPTFSLMALGIATALVLFGRRRPEAH